MFPFRPGPPFLNERTRSRRRIRDGLSDGVHFRDRGTKGRIERCDVFRNKESNIYVQLGSDPWVADCK